MTDGDPVAIKRAWRRRLLAARRARCPEEVAGAGPALARRVLALAEARNVTCVAGYVELPGEPPTAPLLAALLDRGTRVLLPRLAAAGSRFRGVGRRTARALAGTARGRPSTDRCGRCPTPSSSLPRPWPWTSAAFGSGAVAADTTARSRTTATGCARRRPALGRRARGPAAGRAARPSGGCGRLADSDGAPAVTAVIAAAEAGQPSAHRARLARGSTRPAWATSPGEGGMPWRRGQRTRTGRGR